MNLFYDLNAQEGLHLLADDEARHLIRVLRRRVGDEVQVVDGKGTTYVGVVSELTKTSCTLDLRKSEQKTVRSTQPITLAVGPTKKADRMEWLVEKATEIGFDALQPVLCAHGERPKLRLDRLQKSAVSAMKQSLQSHLPAIKDMISLQALLSIANEDQKFIAYLGEELSDTPKNLIEAYTPQPGRGVSILIGPEGGFSSAEVGKAREFGYLPVRLGPNRLRTETAALYAIQCINIAQNLARD
ncbi:MAG: 16S rRNA (uracil(1498)-N(3))-methyltransferase [Bacteroidota bacterium]